MKQALAVKYRPQTFEEVVGQNVTVTILKKALETRSFKNTYLFCGKSGCGKTTLARIFAKEINRGIGDPIEIDAASNNGVDQVRAIIDSANQRSLTGEYKIYIIDEAHAITSQGWQAFLKGIEEPPMYTIFIFCTTEPNKIPATILNRVQRYNISAISNENIKKRLEYICKQEGFTNYDQTCDLISKIAQGGMRDAITYLDQCADYSTDLTIDNSKKIIGDLSYEAMLKLTNFLIDGDEGKMLALIDYLSDTGRDLKQFVNLYLEFVLDILKYILFDDISLTSIPAYLETIQDKTVNVKYTIGIDNNIAWFNALADILLETKTAIKYDSSYKSTIKAYLLRVIRGMTK